MTNPHRPNEGWRDPLWPAARMTNYQFGALACRLSASRLTSELRDLFRRRRITKGAACDSSVVTRWLRNGWSTEQLLRFNSSSLSGDALRHSLHWAFPQAYYSSFAVCSAYFKAVGFTEESHSATIRKFGMEVVAGRYPAAIAFAASGGRTMEFRELMATALPTSLSFEPTDPLSIDGQLAQFLRSTRQADLKSRRADLPLRTKSGRRKRALSATDWDAVGQKLGPTSLLSLLYRKRIKANYRDIDTFLHPEIKAESLYENLLRVVAAVNFVHESFIASALGPPFVGNALAGLPGASQEAPRQRLRTIDLILSATESSRR